ncbi:MAG: proline dehydrogenase family protein [Bacteroidota bacterium]
MLNKIIAAILPYFPRKFVWLFSKKYIAGETLEDAFRVSEELNREGIMVTVDLLGEFITKLDEAKTNKDTYLEIIDAAEKRGINGNYSIKPTMFGLLIDKDVCYQNIHEVVSKAASYNNFIRIDMEDSQCVDLEIELFKKLHAEFPKNVGLVFQAYLKRTFNDLKNLLQVHSKEVPLNFRLCKGIYNESPEIAYKKYDVINQHFLEDIEFTIQNGMYPAIATHDKPIIEGAYQLIEKYNLTPDKYEFQMLYGVTPELRKSILEAGHRMRVYVPFGKHWFGYSTRRLKENPKMVMHIVKALFVKG